MDVCSRELGVYSSLYSLALFVPILLQWACPEFLSGLVFVLKHAVTAIASTLEDLLSPGLP